MQDRLERPDRASASGDFETLEREAHTLIGGAGNIGAKALSALAFELETSSSERNRDKVTRSTKSCVRSTRRRRQRALHCTPDATPPRNGRLLVVEDSQTQAGQLIRPLDARGFDAASVADAEQTLAAFRGGAFDMVISDVVMPGMYGYDFEFEFQGGAATKPEAEYGNDGGKNRDHARDGRAAAQKSSTFLGPSEI